MLFETQAKADNFILYNKEEIGEENGKTPIRSYYCRICGGYHVTSNPSEGARKRFDELDAHLAEMVERFAKVFEGNGPARQDVNKRIVSAVEQCFSQSRIDEAEHLLQDVLSCYDKGEMDASLQVHKLNDFLSIIRQTKEVSAGVDDILVEVDADLRNKDVEVVDKLKKCRRMLRGLRIPFKKQLLKNVKLRLEEREEQVRLMLKNNKPPKKKKYIIRNKADYKIAILYLIEKFEELQTEREVGNIDECKGILEVIENGLDELPKNDDMALLSTLYERWEREINGKQ